MKLLFSDILTTSSPERLYVACDGEKITYVGKSRPQGEFDRVIDGRDRLLSPGFYNVHCHSAMTLFRGLGGGLPLKSWLNDKILPAEDRLSTETVRIASELAIAEMLACGTVSFSDMYFFCDATAEAAEKTGIRANISRSVVSFDENADPASDSRVREAVELYEKWNGAGRIKVDFSLHAEYTNTARMCAYLAGLAQKYGAGMQIHLSETEEEHLACIERRGKTPAAFFGELGVLGPRTVCAHAVWVSDEDIRLLSENKASVVHCPRSNLKLGSGIAPLAKLLHGGVNVALGTDGAASNNRLSVYGEYNLCAVLHNGNARRADLIAPASLLPLIAENGARAQNRPDCGKIEVGYAADFALLRTDRVHTAPILDTADLFAYSAESSDVVMTVVGGDILYENGEYTTIDIERLKYGFAAAAKEFYGEEML